MRFDYPLDDALATLAHVRILRAFLQAPRDQNLTGRGLARLASVSQAQASRTLKKLASHGIVTERRYGTYALYELNEHHVLAQPIRRLFESEEAVGEDLFTFLAQGVAQASRHVRTAVLFGEAAWGDVAAAEELELAVLCAPGRETDVEVALDDLDRSVRRRYGIPLNLLVSSRKRAIDCVRRQIGPWPRIASHGVPVFRTFPRVR